MSMIHRRNWLLHALGWSGAACVASQPLATACFHSAGSEKKKKLRFGEFNPDHDVVDLFDGMEEGRLQVRLICKDSTEASVLIVNKSKKPLNVRLPSAFGGVPVVPPKKSKDRLPAGESERKVGLLDGSRTRPANVELPAGWDGIAGLGQGFPIGGNPPQQQQQSVGGGFNGGGNNAGGVNARGGNNVGIFNVPPEKLVQLKTPLVCLEHGKKNPNRGVTYLLKKIDEVSQAAGVRELCAMLAGGSLSQTAAQAAAWHLANGLSWAELTAKRLEHVDGTSEKYFTSDDLAAGRRAAAEALAAASPKPAETTSGNSIRQTAERAPVRQP